MFEKLRTFCKKNDIERMPIAEQAYSLLENEAFLVACDSVQENLLQESVFSKPEETMKREDIYKKYNLVTEIKQELAKLASFKQTHDKEQNNG